MDCTTLYSQSAVSLFISFRVRAGNISVHLCWLLTCTCKVFPSFLHESVSSIFLLQNCCSELINTYCHTQKQKTKKWKLNHNNILLFLYCFLSSLIRKGSLTSCEEELREVQWFQVDFVIPTISIKSVGNSRLLLSFIPFFLLLCSWPIVEQNSIYNNNVLIQLFLNIELGRVIKGENHLFWTSKWTTVKFYSLCNYFRPGVLVDFLFSLSARPRRQRKLKIKLGDL